MASLPTNTPSDPPPVIDLRKISYSCDNINILKNVDLKLYSSEFHAVVGDHGSGKSSLGMILGGQLNPSEGEIRYRQKSYPFLTLKQTRKFGIEMISQEIQLIDYFSVTENLLIPDRVYRTFPFCNKKRLIQEARNLLTHYGFDLDPTTLVKNLPLSDRMVIHILRSVYRQPEVLIVDAVLEKLTAGHLEKIIDILGVLKKGGTSILCITHNIDDIYSLADKVTIIRNGEIILTDTVNHIDKIHLIKLCYTQMSGNDQIENYQDFYQLLRYNEAILQKLPVNLIVSDNANRIKMINDSGQHYFHLTQKNYRNLLLDDLFSSDNQKALSLIKEAILSKRQETFYNVPLVIDFIKSITNITVLPIYDGAFPIGHITIIEDVSKQEKLRQQVILSEKLASVGILAAGVAHEINNPLEIIYNHLNYLRFNLDRDQLNQTVAHIEEELEDIKQIVSNLISFSDSSKMVSETFELNQLIGSIINLIRFNAKKQNIKIDYKPAAAPIHVNANINEIKQVLLNLLKNSFEATQSGGKIDIRTRRTETENRPCASIIFMDNGMGIEDDNPDNIFLPFYSTKKGNGTNLGLGLSVSYGIIKKYNGSISVKNMKRGGCRFKIILPEVSHPGGNDEF